MTESKSKVVENEQPQSCEDEMLLEKEIGGLKLQVIKGKLWLQKADAIVSPCENTELRHEKGVAKELVNFAGPLIFEISNELVQKENGLVQG